MLPGQPQETGGQPQAQGQPQPQQQQLNQSGYIEPQAAPVPPAQLGVVPAQQQPMPGQIQNFQQQPMQGQYGYAQPQQQQQMQGQNGYAQPQQQQQMQGQYGYAQPQQQQQMQGQYGNAQQPVYPQQQMPQNGAAQLQMQQQQMQQQPLMGADPGAPEENVGADGMAIAPTTLDFNDPNCGGVFAQADLPQYTKVIEPKGGPGCMNAWGRDGRYHYLAMIILFVGVLALLIMLVEASGVKIADWSTATWLIIIGILWLFVVLEAYGSAEMKFIQMLIPSGQLINRIERVDATPPTFHFWIQCYHMERHTRRRKNRNGGHFYETYYERVNTHRATMQYPVDQWADFSQDFPVANLLSYKMCQVVCQSNYVFATQQAQQRFNQTFLQFICANIRDRQFDRGMTFAVSGYTDKYSGMIPSKQDASFAFISSAAYLFSALFCCGIPYRMWYNGKCGVVHYGHVKGIMT